MSLRFEAKIGKKRELYLPKAVAEALNVDAGGRVLVRLSGRTVTVESLQDPIKLALEGKKFASVTVDEVEGTSLEHQRKATGHSA